MGQLVSQYGVHPIQVGLWEKTLIDRAETLFEGKKSCQKDDSIDREELEKKIRQLTMENDFLKKTEQLTIEEKQLWIDPNEQGLSIAAQCKILRISRSSYYYKPAGLKVRELLLMRCVDEIYTAWPFYGSRQITQELKKKGHNVNRKRIQKIMQWLGLIGNQAGPNTSKSHPQHLKFPYLLNRLVILEPLHVWSTDIRYIRLPNGFVYLVAVIDWFSRLVLSYRISNSLETTFCLDACEEAIKIYGRPQHFYLHPNLTRKWIIFLS